MAMITVLEMLIVILITVATFLNNPSSAVMATVSHPCNNDSSCIGSNEYCQNTSSWLNPPTITGICQCLENFTTGGFSFEGWNAGYSNCAEFKTLSIGDRCTPDASNEKILAINAECSDAHVVTCYRGYSQVGQETCMRDGFGFGEGPCTWATDCIGGLMCNNRICQCYTSSQKYDPTINDCLPKEYGDPCVEDEDCKVLGGFGTWYGFTATSAACINGSCLCGNNTKTEISWIDGTTREFKTKTICVNPTAKVDQPLGADCNDEPIKWADNPDLKVCAKDFICISDRDRYQWQGKCRQIVGPLPPAVTYIRPTVQYWPNTLATPGAETTIAPSIDQSSTYSYPHYPGLLDVDLAIAQVVNRTFINYKNLRQCSPSYGCRSNEQCLMPVQCGRGFCACVAPNYYSSDGYDDNCLVAADTSSEATISTSVASTAIFTSTTTTPATNFYNSKCNASDECLGEANLVCRGSSNGGRVCLCPESMLWRSKIQQCQLRDYGDPCNSDEECSNGIYVKQTANGHKCTNNSTCGCADGFTPVTSIVLMAAWGRTTVPTYVQHPDSSRLFCVPTDQLTANVSIAGNCTLNVLERSDTSVHICKAGLVCLACPLDASPANQHQTGTCVHFEYPPAMTKGENELLANAILNTKNAGDALMIRSGISLMVYFVALPYAVFRQL